MKKLVSALIIMTMILTSLTVPMSVSAADAAQTSSDNILLVEDFEGETNKFDANITNVDAFGGKTGKVGAIDYNSDGNIKAVVDIGDVYSGGVKISYDAYLLVGNGNRPIFANPAEGDTDGSDYDLLQVFQKNIKVVRDGDSIYSANADEWVHIEQIINLDMGVIQTKVYSMNNELLGQGSYSAGCSSIGQITFYNWGKSSVFNIDNIKAEICDLTPTAGVVVSEDFEKTDGTNVFNGTCTNTTIDNYTGQVGEIAGTTKAPIDIDDVYSGGVKISYSVNILGGSGNRRIWIVPAVGDEVTNNCNILQVFQDDIKQKDGGSKIVDTTTESRLNIEQYLNLDAGVVETKVYSMAGVLQGRATYNIGCNSIGSIIFENASPTTTTAFYLDNVVVEIYEIKSIGGTVLTEDFEKADGTNVFDANCTNTVLTRGTENWNTGAVSKGNKKATMEFDNISTGGVKLSYDIYVVSGGERFIYINSASTENEVLYIFQYRVYDQQASKGTDNSGYMCLDDANSWLSVEQYIDLDKQKMETMVYTEDDELLAVDARDITFESVDSLVFHNYSPTTSSDFYIDNINVETYDTTPESEVLVTESFEGDTINLDGNCVIDTETFTPEKVGKIEKATSVLDFEDVYTGKVKISFDAYAFGGDTNTNCMISVIPATHGTTSLKTDILQIFQKRIRYIVEVVEKDPKNIYANENGWYHIEQILDLEEGTAHTQVYDADRTELLATYEENVGCYSIGKLSFNSSGSHPFYFDNIHVEKYIDRPEVTEIAAYDIFGKKVESFANATHAIERIEVIFDEEIAKSNPSTYFVLANNGSQINIAGKMNDNVYTMTIKDKLMPGKTYTISISEKVENLEGNAANQNYTTTLTTVDASEVSNEVKINTFTKEENIIIVEAGYINAGSGELPIVFMVAFYDANGIMLGVAEPQVKDSSDTYGYVIATFDDYAGEGTVAETRLFFWDSLLGMHPYGGTETL